ncbi:MAG: SdrD B-like domain-containing protein, partial [Methanothrix sp.]|nr:SdrD B-like domain-containing protein [Methanothrix sp.]
MSPMMARSAGIFFTALLILLAATAPASGACTMSVADSESISNPNGIFILNGIGYIASTADNGKLFVMPVNPITSGSSYDVSNPAYDVSVSGSNAYMTEGSSGVEVVNAANGAHLGLCTNWDSNLFAIGIYISGSYAYVGAAGGTTDGCLVVLSLANPNSPSVVKTISCGSMNSGGGGLCVTDDKIYLATDNTIDVFSISSPENPVANSPLSISGAYDVHVFGGKIYVVAPSSSPSVTVRDLSNPTVVQDCYNAGSPYAIQFYEGYIYIVGPDNGLEKLNVGSVSGSLTVNLDAIPNSAQDFSFLGDLGTFTLDDDSGATGADDTYSNTKIFSSLAAGYYAFHQTVPSGWIVSSITASDASKVTYSSDGNSWHSTFISGDTWAKASVQAGGSLTVSFQDTRVYSISGHVIYDLDGNGAKNNFEGYVPNGWVVQLWKDGTQTSQTTTLSGAYSFSNLPAGNYEVRSILQTGWVNTLPASGIRSYSPLSSDQTNQDFTVRGSQSIAGMKFHDLDGDRAKDAGEPGLASWTIDLKKDGTKIASTQTAAGGAYSFAGLAPGSYTVEETLQSGWTQSYPASPGTHAVTLVAGVAGPTDRDFGNYQPTGFSGVKFEDSNGNGAKDAGETGISGWTIKLKQGTTEIASIQTGTGGAYSFNGLAPGSYTVEEVAQSGWTRSYPATPGTHTITLASGVAGPTDINFGNWRTTGFSGMKFEDLNGNGARDADEPGLEGWTIKLMSGGTEIASTQTDADGAYSFTDIAPGSYTVEEASQAGWAQTYPASPGTHTINLVSGVAGPTNINFGNARATGFSGMKFEDLNGNGVKDLGEPGLEGWTIKLMSGVTEISSTQTDADGAYSFTDIAPGSYTVQEVAQAGWTQSYPASPGTHAITLVSGVAGPTDIDFGNWKSTGFSGMKFEDLNGNGAKDAGEPGLKDWTIKLMSGSTELGSTQTGTDGAYSFSGIAPGSYTVQEVAQAGWTQSYPTSPGTHAITLASGVAGPMDLDFGNWKSTGFSGQKFEDLNGNGAKDAGEPGLADWTIRLMKGATVVASALTLADGAYSFTGIAPGSYIVEETAQAGWTQSYPASPGTQTVNLVSGAAGPTDIDFGNWRATGFSGMKFNDLDRNGARDAGEPGLSGWTIKLMKGATEISSTQTAADGSYSFTDIAPGSYTVEEAAQSGWVQSYPATPGMHPITLVSGIAGPTDIDFGNRGSLAISGMKFHDKNANGKKDDGEPGLSGWEIQLKDSSDNLLQTATTSAEPGKEGVYEFADLSPRTYRVYEASKNGWVRTAPAEDHYTITLTDSSSRGNLFGNNQLAISGMKFHDKNANGVMDDGEPGLSGWEIQLKDSSDNLLQTATTSSEPGKEGVYEFVDLQPGTYLVYEVQKSGWVRTVPEQEYHTVTLTNMPSRGNLFGNDLVKISGTKFEDFNGNGAKDSGELGLSGWTIRLTKEGTEVANTVTAADGSYSFTGIAPGSYTVEEAAHAGWTQSYPLSGTHTFSLASGESGRSGLDFGNFRPTGFAGTKFEDLNGNGAKDSGEPGLSG